MSLTILNVAYPLASVGPDSVGGAEQVLSSLDYGLVRAGHRSLVLASSGSKVAGTLIPSPYPPNRLDNATKSRAVRAHREAIEHTLRHWKVDLVHLHGIDAYDYLPSGTTPTLITLHLPPHWYPQELFAATRPHTYVHCVSLSQHRSCPRCSYLLPPIENGVEVARFQALHAKRDFALALGRICPEKGFHLALDAAALARVPLLLAGEVFGYESHRTYFAEQILPRLGGKRRFIGALGFKRKRRLLSAAKCLVVPSTAPETSSLVTMEALASGTPVVAFPSGALAELIEHGKTGFLVNNIPQMAAAITACERLDPNVCRKVAQARFSFEHTIEKYFHLYSRLIATNKSKVPCRGQSAMQVISIPPGRPDYKCSSANAPF